MPDGIKKHGAAAIDEIVMGMRISGPDRVKQLLAAGHHSEAIKEANSLSPDDLRKLAADLSVDVGQEHEVDENPTDTTSDLREVEGEDNSDNLDAKAPNQIKEEAEPPGGLEDPKEESPETTVPDDQVSEATKGAASETEETEETEEVEETKEVKTTKEVKEVSPEDEEKEAFKRASLQGYVKGSQDAMVTIMRALKKRR